MKLIGFNFSKINVERFKDKVENLKFNTKIDILSIDTLKSNFLKMKEEVIKIDFVYILNYEPEYAKLELGGNILLSMEYKLAKDILEKWKDKAISEEFRMFIFNIILRKSNIKSIQLEEEIGLPIHLPLPSLNKENKKEEFHSDKNLKE